MAEQTTTRKAPEEGPQQAVTTKCEVVDITGNVAWTPELWAGGTAICNVRLAVDGDDGHTRWYTVTAWEHLAEAVGAHVEKGDRLGIRGPLGKGQWTGRDGAERTEAVVTAWIFHLHRHKPVGATGMGE